MAEMKVSVSTINRVYKSLKRKSYIARDNQARDERIILKWIVCLSTFFAEINGKLSGKAVVNLILEVYDH